MHVQICVIFNRFIDSGCCLFCCYIAYVSLGQTDWDNEFKKQCGNDAALTRIVSNHNNGKEDRRWTYYCSPGYSLNDGTSSWTGIILLHYKYLLNIIFFIDELSVKYLHVNLLIVGCWKHFRHEINLC